MNAPVPPIVELAPLSGLKNIEGTLEKRRRSRGVPLIAIAAPLAIGGAALLAWRIATRS
jgi:hypothetical protein